MRRILDMISTLIIFNDSHVNSHYLSCLFWQQPLWVMISREAIVLQFQRETLTEILIWSFWPNLLMEYSRISLIWLSSAPYIDFDIGFNAEYLRFSPTNACVLGNYAVNDLPLSLFRGIGSCTVSSCYFNLVDLIVLKDKLIVWQLALLGTLSVVLSSVW